MSVVRASGVVALAVRPIGSGEIVMERRALERVAKRRVIASDATEG